MISPSPDTAPTWPNGRFFLLSAHRYLHADEALLAGLVHDIGELYILKSAAKQPALFEDPETIEEFVVEWHTGVGGAIVEAWGFSEAIVLATDEHEVLTHNPKEAPDLTCVVIVANLLAKLEMKEIESVNFDAVPAFRRLGLGGETSEEILRESAAEIRSTVEALRG